MGPRLPALTAVVVTAALAGCTNGSVASSSPGPDGCRSGAPEAGVWAPDRLQVRSPCALAEGVVVEVVREVDGDRHIWFRVDPGYEHLLNADNHFQARPAMLAEITPDCPLDTNPPDGGTAARCPPTSLSIPAIGDHISVRGPWVLDKDHGWNEIHPVESIQIRHGG